MLSRIQRVFKHRWANEAYRTFSDVCLLKLQTLIANSESLHSGEIRLCIEAGLPNSYLLRADTTPALLRQRALAQFGRLRVWDTEHNNGVMIYLCLAERSIELIADRGVNRLVSARQWDSVVERLSTALSRGDLEGGLVQAIAEVDEVLQQHFAVRAGQTNPNELSDAPALI
ncbi:MAG: hypothetical protein RLZ68_2436 [Pseudomonadota bacterium]|jgi:uncharacterized membrane protein